MSALRSIELHGEFVVVQHHTVLLYSMYGDEQGWVWSWQELI